MKMRLFADLTILIAISILVTSFITKASQNNADTNQSVYTDISSKTCKTIKLDEETATSTQICSGIEGYKLLVYDSDDRSSITVISPDGKEHPLEYWQVVTQGFSSLGAKAEWRIKKEKGKTIPIALITRVNASEDPDNYKKTTSYLVVTKLSKQKICVVGKIPPKANANLEAQKLADIALSKPCLE